MEEGSEGKQERREKIEKVRENFFVSVWILQGFLLSELTGPVQHLTQGCL